MKLLIITLSLIISGNSLGDILGDFSKSKKLPGYIDFSSNSLVQRDPFFQKKNKDDLENRSPSEILGYYFRDGSFDKTSFLDLLEKIKLKEKNEFIAFCIDNSLQGIEACTINDEVIKKWQSDGPYLAYNELKKLIPETIELSNSINPSELNHSEAVPFLDHFFSTLELWETLKRPYRELGKPSKVGRIVKINLVNYLIGGNKFSIERENPESANLLIPKEYSSQYPGQLFFSPEQLRNLEKKGVDISKFNPPNSDLWRKPNFPIGDFDLTNYNGNTKKNLKHIFEEEFVDDLMDAEKTVDIEYVFDQTPLGGTPQFLGKIKGQDFIVKYATDRVAPYPKSTDLLNFFHALTNQTEAYTEKVVNNLTSAMGFTVEPTYFKNKVRLLISKKDSDFDSDFKRLLKEVVNSNMEFNHPESAFQIVKFDEETGLNYIELHNVSLKKKNDGKTDIDVSFFVRHGLGKHLKREHRALAFIQALLEDVDPRDEKGQIKLIPYKDKNQNIRYNPVAMVAEMGSSLGFGMPNFFSKEFVTNVKKDRRGVKRVDFRYRRFYPLPILKTVTVADAKWVMRLFGQFSYDQVYKSFESSGFPPLIADLMTRKLMGRRNQVMKALGLLGEKVVDVNGNELVLSEEKEFGDSIEGYEEYFKKGFLDDPEDKLFPDDDSPFKRFWSVSFNPKVGGKRIKSSFKNIGELILAGANISASSLLSKFKYDLLPILKEFEPIEDFDNLINKVCVGGNCFAQALSVGPMGLIPFSFVIDNPDKTSKKPFLIVNMFRIGVKASSKINLSSPIFSSSGGPDTPSPAASFFSLGSASPNAELVGGVAAIKEFITVSGTDNLLTYSRDLKKVVKIPSLISHQRLRKYVENLEVGQSLLMSSYFSAELHGYQNFAPFGFGGAIGGGLIFGLTNRMVLNKADKNQILAHWSKLTKKEFEVLLQAKAYFGIDIAGLKVGHTKVRDRTFKFDSTNPQEMKYVMENLQSITPQSIPDKFRYQERLLNEASAEAKAGLLFFLNAKISSAKGEMILRDFITGEEKQEDFRIIRIFKNRPIGKNTVDYETVYKTSMDEESNVFVNVTSNFSSGNLTREKLIKVVEKLEGFLPQDFIPYDLDTLGYYLGEVKLQAMTIIPHEGLAQFFNKGEKEICELYAEMNDLSKEDCEKSSKSLPLKIFLKDFRQAQMEFLKVNNKQLIDRGEKLRALNQILDIFSRFTRNHSILHLIIKTISLENYYTDAALASDFLLGNTEILSLDKDKRGGFTPSLRHKVIDPAKQFEIFSDDLTHALGDVFFQFN